MPASQLMQVVGLLVCNLGVRWEVCRGCEGRL